VHKHFFSTVFVGTIFQIFITTVIGTDCSYSQICHPVWVKTRVESSVAYIVKLALSLTQRERERVRVCARHVGGSMGTCGTSACIYLGIDILPLTETLNFLLERKEPIS
jgi:hypothetical protein